MQVDLTYCVLDGRVFCERHYAERVRPRCGACDELIFSGEYTRAMGRDWHCAHFCCRHCDGVLTGRRYAVPPAGGEDGGGGAEHPCCLDCYEKKFTHDCQKCGKRIGVEDKDMAYKEMHWHEVSLSY